MPADRSGTSNKWYPYFKVQDGYYDLSDTVKFPRKICDYLIDAPIPNIYEPIDNNAYPRCRLWKYLYHDEALPLELPLPTIEQKKSVVFNPERAESAPTDKGYRLIPQIFVKPAQSDGQTRIYAYMGRTVPSTNDYTLALSVVFDIYTHYAYESNTKSDEYSRVFGIEQALIEALHGVNMTGVGTFYFSRLKHADCGSRPIYDGNTNVGRQLVVALEVATTAANTAGDTDNMPSIGNNIRLA